MTRTSRRAASPRSAPRCVPAPVVRAAIARAVLGTRAIPDFDTVQLFPHQRDAVARIRLLLGTHRVTLLADDVGLGKTFVALAIARDYPSTLVMAPAALLPMWRAAIERTGVQHVQLESLHRYSRLTDSVHGPGREQLVIIDEAHHVRTPSTRRYAAVARRVAGADLLLVSATPIHNHPDDLRALLALGMGARASRLTPALLADVIVRRTHQAARPRVRECPPQIVPHDPALLEDILALPAPLPAHDGAVAGALIRLGLLRAWCSSDAALAHTIQQRLRRGDALRQALLAGRHPTRVELRSWIAVDDDLQLGFPELLAATEVTQAPLLAVLTTHLDAVRQLGERHRRSACGDAARVTHLRGVLASYPETPVIAFSQFSATVTAIGRALADIAGVGVITGARARIASGRISRQDALHAFAPRAHGRPPPPAHQRIRLLLTTDLLAEGVNLQDAGVVVHLDLPWTDALKRQRVGRCARVGSLHAEVAVHAFAPPSDAAAALRLHERLARKARWSERLVGRPTRDRVVAATSARSARAPEQSASQRSVAELASAVRARLARWLVSSPHHAADDACLLAMTSGATAQGAGVRALVLVALPPMPDAHGERALHELLVVRWITRTDRPPHLRVSRAVRHVWAAVRVASHGAAHPESSPASASHDALLSDADVVERAVTRWWRRRQCAREFGRREHNATPAQLRAHRALQLALSRLSPSQRLAERDAVAAARTLIDQVRGVAAERALVEWIARGSQFAVGSWLAAWRDDPVLASLATVPSIAAPPAVTGDDQRAPAIRAILFLGRLDGGS